MNNNCRENIKACAGVTYNATSIQGVASVGYNLKAEAVLWDVSLCKPIDIVFRPVEVWFHMKCITEWKPNQKLVDYYLSFVCNWSFTT